MLEVKLSVLKNIPPERGGNYCVRRFREAFRRAGSKLFMGSDVHRGEVLTANHASQVDLIKRAEVFARPILKLQNPVYRACKQLERTHLVTVKARTLFKPFFHKRFGNAKRRLYVKTVYKVALIFA